MAAPIVLERYFILATSKKDALSPQQLRQKDFERMLEQARESTIASLERHIRNGHRDTLLCHFESRVEVGDSMPGYETEFEHLADSCMKDICKEYRQAGWNVNITGTDKLSLHTKVFYFQFDERL
jgi:hypothetical protein